MLLYFKYFIKRKSLYSHNMNKSDTNIFGKKETAGYVHSNGPMFGLLARKTRLMLGMYLPGFRKKFRGYYRSEAENRVPWGLRSKGMQTSQTSRVCQLLKQVQSSKSLGSVSG